MHLLIGLKLDEVGSLIMSLLFFFCTIQFPPGYMLIVVMFEMVAKKIAAYHGP